MRTLIKYCLLIGTTFLLVTSCGNKQKKVESDPNDPINSIVALSEEISSNGDDWDEAKWDEAAEKLASFWLNMPSPLETKEEVQLSSAIAKMEVIASMHERKAASFIEALKECNLNKNKDLDGTYSLEGRVDKYPIVMNIEIEGEKVKGTYFYKKNGPSAQLSLSGTNEDGNLDLNETDKNGTPTGHFKGKIENGIFKGFFVDNKSNKMPFVVSEVAIDESSVDFTFEDDEAEVPDDYDSYPDIEDNSEVSLDDEGDESIDAFIDEYEKFWKSYMSFLRKADTKNPTWIVEYGKLMKQANNYSSKLQKVQGKMSVSQFERLNKMSMEILKDAQKFEQ